MRAKGVWVYHDDFYEDKDGNTRMLTSHIADNFDDFLEMLMSFWIKQA